MGYIGLTVIREIPAMRTVFMHYLYKIYIGGSDRENLMDLLKL